MDMALTSAHQKSLRFLFTSSIGSVHSWDRSRGLYPEEVLLDSSSAVGSGYGESKYVSERVSIATQTGNPWKVLFDASNRSSSRVASMRRLYGLAS